MSSEVDGLGFFDALAHEVNECVASGDVERGRRTFRRINQELHRLARGCGIRLGESGNVRRKSASKTRVWREKGIEDLGLK